MGDVWVGRAGVMAGLLGVATRAFRGEHEMRKVGLTQKKVVVSTPHTHPRPPMPSYKSSQHLATYASQSNVFTFKNSGFDDILITGLGEESRPYYNVSFSLSVLIHSIPHVKPPWEWLRMTRTMCSEIDNEEDRREEEKKRKE